jgi:predicted CoA-binding protein
MVTKKIIDDFLSRRKLAVVGVSRKPRKFGNIVHRDLTKKGYQVYPVSSHMEIFEGQPCYPSLPALPEVVSGVVVVVPPTQTERVVRNAAEADIRRIWLQPGAESPSAIRFCEENNISVVHGECILMHAQPVTSIHGIHRWLWKLLGKLPK